MRTNICIGNMIVTVALVKQWRRLGAVYSGTINLWHPRFSSRVLTTSCSFGIHRWRIISRKYHRGLGIKIKLIAGRRSLCLYGAAMLLPLAICTSCVRLGFVKVFLALFLSLQPVYRWQSPLKCWEESKRLLFLKELASHRPGLEDDNEQQPPLSSKQSSSSSGKRQPAGPVPFPRDKAAGQSALLTAAEARAHRGDLKVSKMSAEEGKPCSLWPGAGNCMRSGLRSQQKALPVSGGCSQVRSWDAGLGQELLKQDLRVQEAGLRFVLSLRFYPS